MWLWCGSVLPLVEMSPVNSCHGEPRPPTEKQQQVIPGQCLVFRVVSGKGGVGVDIFARETVPALTFNWRGNVILAENYLNTAGTVAASLLCLTLPANEILRCGE